MGVGEESLLSRRTIGILASRSCPGNILLDTLDQIPKWLEEGRAVMSGFHSPLEQQVLRSTIRHDGFVVKVLARGLTNYRPQREEREALESGRMLVLTSFPPEVRRTTRATALERNGLILSLADDIVVPHISKGSALSSLIQERARLRDGKGKSREFGDNH